MKFKKGAYIEAAKEYELALKCDPEMVFVHKSLGMIYHKYLKQPDNAFYHMQKYIEMKKTCYGISHLVVPRADMVIPKAWRSILTTTSYWQVMAIITHIPAQTWSS